MEGTGPEVRPNIVIRRPAAAAAKPRRTSAAKPGPPLVRCPWCESTPLYRAYHDREWGVPVHSDRRWFEMLVLDGAQAGLSWRTILEKRAGYRRAFDRFDPRKVARYDARKVRSLLRDPGIVRNRQKVASAVTQRARLPRGAARSSGASTASSGASRGAARSRTVAGAPADPGPHAALGRDERGAAAARIQVRGLDHRLRPDAGGGHGERPPGHLLPPPRKCRRWRKQVTR